MATKTQIVQVGERWKDESRIDGGVTIQRKGTTKKSPKQKKSTSKK